MMMKLLVALAALLAVCSARNVLPKNVKPRAARDCGSTPIKPDLNQTRGGGRIVGGTEAKPYSWPWQIGLMDSYFGSLSLICGGSIINEEWIMSAGHCVDGSEDDPEGFRIKLGAFDRSSEEDDEEGLIIAEVDKILTHPKWSRPTLEFDVSLLHLTKPVKFTDHIQPVCLPTEDLDVIVKDDTCWVTGWGTLHEGDYGLPKKLHQVEVPFLDMAKCHEEYGESSINDECMFCAGRTGKDSCQGDSGGPVVVKSADERWFEYGIVSWGYGCAEPGHAGVYSRVTAYCEFIKDTTGEDLCEKH